RLVCGADSEPAGRFQRVAFDLDDGRRLGYEDQRKLKGIWLAATDADIDRIIGDQGPDALSLSRAELDRLLEGRRGRVKATLTDQAVIAGLGNLLGDEILWHARIHPRRPVNALTDGERDGLHSALREVLRASVRAGRVPDDPDWLTGRRDDPDPHCPRCGNPLRRGRISGRTSLWCPHCQREDA
ncbi:Fpg/Nei family DNA glycosylase, partial [Streptomyces albiflaviniger]|nr:Fpg/Nei family DNA glycosylase [Streptomyces albiflaviniger]